MGVRLPRQLTLMADEASRDHQIDQLLRDGTGVLRSATQLSHPSCVVCGKPQSRYYVDMVETKPGKYVSCIPCANSRYAGEGPLVIDPDAPGQRATNIQIWPGASLRIVDADGY